MRIGRRGVGVVVGRALAGAVVLVLGGGGEAATADDDEQPPPSSEAAAVRDPMAVGDPHWGHEALVAGPTPPGKEPIIFNDGGVPGLAGYIDSEDPDDVDRPGHPLPIGSGRYEVWGQELTDADGVLLGYAVGTVGLVDLATARDVELMDALLAEGEARHRAVEERNAALAQDEEAMERLFGIEVDDGG
jgi:hypothetical protein